MTDKSVTQILVQDKPKAVKDLSGQKFGNLTVICYLGIKKPAHYWTCLCNCGTQTNVRSGNLKNGHTSSCGCLQKQSITGSNHYRARQCTPDSVSKHPLCGTYSAMMARCYRNTAFGYRRYGGRGIKVCDRWVNSPELFFKDMGERPEGCTLDRIDNDGDYEPKNCRWATNSEQSSNRNSTILNKNLVVRMRKMKADGIKVRKIRDDLAPNVNLSTVYSALNGKTWNSV